jgi:large subunit ribosomal protein L25
VPPLLTIRLAKKIKIGYSIVTMTTLQSFPRTNETAEELRNGGKIPAVIYGKGVKSTIHIAIEREAFKKAWNAAGSSTAVTISGNGEDHDCIIHDYQIDPRTDMIIHADFLALDKNTKVTVQVHLEFVGESPAVKSGAGVLEKPLHEIEIEALPANLPKSILVDLSKLDVVGSAIHIKDLVLTKGVEVKGHEADDVVAVIGGIKEEKEEVSTPIDFSAIEVEKKGKKEEESAEGAEEKK